MATVKIPPVLRASVGGEKQVAAEDAEVLVADADGVVVGICTVYLDIDSVRFGLRAWVEDLAHAQRP